MIISIDVEKAFDKVQHPFMIKNTQQSGNRGSITICKNLQPTSQSISKSKAFPLRPGTRQGCRLSPLLFNILLEALTIAIRQGKEIIGIQTGKEESQIIVCRYDSVHRKSYRLHQKTTLRVKVQPQQVSGSLKDGWRRRRMRGQTASLMLESSQPLWV